MVNVISNFAPASNEVLGTQTPVPTAYCRNKNRDDLLNLVLDFSIVAFVITNLTTVFY